MNLTGHSENQTDQCSERAIPRLGSRVSVVVVNHNRSRLLEDCLGSLLNQSLSPLEIIVVDNGSSDESSKVVRSYSEAGISLLPLSENRGFAEACNLGIGSSQGEFVALLNNDAVADARWLEHLLDESLDHPQAGMFASKILFYDTRIIDKAGHLIFPDGQNRGRGTGEADVKQYDRSEYALFPDGCAAMYRRKLLEEVGGFDEEFFAYADDADLGIRAQLLGWSCRYVPSAVVYHHHSSTLGAFSEQKIYWIERNRLWLAIKTFPLALLVLNPFFSLYRWSWNLIAALSRRGAAGSFRRQHSLPVLIWTVFRAYRDALRGLPVMLRKRRLIRMQRKLSDLQFYRLLWRYRISARRLTLEGRIK